MARFADRERYFEALAETSRSCYRPYIDRFKTLGDGAEILEIGCGEGGNLLPFAEAGFRVTGIDISPNKIRNARTYFAKREARGEFDVLDFLDGTEFPEGPVFDLILIHDVIEHIEPEYKDRFFARLSAFLKPGGLIFWGFPAWQMPFGGHQQICRSRACTLPFLHLLPAGWYERWLRAFKEDPETIRDLMSIKRSKMTVERFEELCGAHGLRIEDRILWLVNPHYKAKFGLTPRRLPRWVAAVPRVRNFFATACFYLTSFYAD